MAKSWPRTPPSLPITSPFVNPQCWALAALHFASNLQTPFALNWPCCLLVALKSDQHQLTAASHASCVCNDKPVIHSVQGSNINGCVIGCNSYVGQGAYLEDSLIMGNDNYTNDKERAAARQRGESVLGIGE